MDKVSLAEASILWYKAKYGHAFSQILTLGVDSITETMPNFAINLLLYKCQS